jgi:hypothetical protein
VRRSGPFADDVRVATDGVTLTWPRRSPEARYCGVVIPWSRIRDADPDAYIPELRLAADRSDDGAAPDRPDQRSAGCRTVFIRRDHHPALAEGLTAAGVTIRRRPDVWADLLEPFLDKPYDEAARARCEGRLHGWGFTDPEIQTIRRRVRLRMTAITDMTWEWVIYGHADLLLATSHFPASRYLAFRAWADTIAARAGGR